MRLSPKLYKYIPFFLITAGLLSSRVYATAPWDDAGFIDNFVSRYVVLTPGSLIARFYNILFPIGLVVGLFADGFAGYTIMTSQGSPEKVKEGSEKLTSAVVGMIFIVLSIVILRIIIGSLLDDVSF